MALVQTSLSPTERDELLEFVDEVGIDTSEWKEYAQALIMVAIDPQGAFDYIQAVKERAMGAHLAEE